MNHQLKENSEWKSRIQTHGRHVLISQRAAPTLPQGKTGPQYTDNRILGWASIAVMQSKTLYNYAIMRTKYTPETIPRISPTRD